MDIKKTIILPELSYKLMGVLYSVHNELGSTMLEKHYQRAIAKELAIQHIPFQQEVPIILRYKQESIGKYFLDFIIEKQIILETKAQIDFKPSFFKQALAYLRQTQLPLAIIVNFKSDRLTYKRIINYSNHS